MVKAVLKLSLLIALMFPYNMNHHHFYQVLFHTSSICIEDTLQIQKLSLEKYKVLEILSIGLCLFVWCLTARQHRIGQFVPTAGGWNRLRWLRMANERQCIILNTLHKATQFTIKNSKLQKYNNRLSNRMTYLLKYYVSSFTNTLPM